MIVVIVYYGSRTGKGMKWARGAMETRLTTDQKIPGSTPGRLEFFFFGLPFFFKQSPSHNIFANYRRYL